MDLREWDREHELWVTEKVASEIYRTQRIDYKVHKPKNNNEEDAILVDTSGKNPSMTVEVVSAPVNQEIVRRDRKNPITLKDTLKNRLQKIGVQNGDFLISWSDEAARLKIRGEQVEKLAQLVASRSGDLYGQLTILPEEIYDEFPRLAWLFNYVRCFRMESLTDICVNNTMFCYLPRDGRWIEGAIAKKVNRIADVLIVDGGCYVDREQVDAFAAAFDPEAYRFKQIWIVNTHEVFRIKPHL